MLIRMTVGIGGRWPHEAAIDAYLSGLRNRDVRCVARRRLSRRASVDLGCWVVSAMAVITAVALVLAIYGAIIRGQVKRWR
jgi:hypothetical protein